MSQRTATVPTSMAVAASHSERTEAVSKDLEELLGPAALARQPLSDQLAQSLHRDAAEDLRSHRLGGDGRVEHDLGHLAEQARPLACASASASLASARSSSLRLKTRPTRTLNISTTESVISSARTARKASSRV
jgi:hypothetical protein